jgi:hypothetical protein
MATEYLAYATMGSSMSRTRTPWGVKVQRTYSDGRIMSEYAGFYRSETEAKHVADRLNELFAEPAPAVRGRRQYGSGPIPISCNCLYLSPAHDIGCPWS